MAFKIGNELILDFPEHMLRVPLTFPNTVLKKAQEMFTITPQELDPLKQLLEKGLLENLKSGDKTIAMAKPNSLSYQLVALQEQLKLSDAELRERLSRSKVIIYDAKNLKRINEDTEHGGSYEAGSRAVQLHYLSALNLEHHGYRVIMDRPQGDECLILAIPGAIDATIQSSAAQHSPTELIDLELEDLISKLGPDDPIKKYIEQNGTTSVAKKYSTVDLASVPKIGSERANRMDDLSEILMDIGERESENAPTGQKNKGVDVIDLLMQGKENVFGATENEIKSLDNRLAIVKRYSPKEFSASIDELLSTETAATNEYYRAFVIQIAEEALFNFQFDRGQPILNEWAWKQLSLEKPELTHFGQLSIYLTKEANNKYFRLAGTAKLTKVAEMLGKANIDQDQVICTKIGGSFYINGTAAVMELLEKNIEDDNTKKIGHDDGENMIAFSNLEHPKSNEIKAGTNIWEYLDTLRSIHYEHETEYVIAKLTMNPMNWELLSRIMIERFTKRFIDTRTIFETRFGKKSGNPTLSPLEFSTLFGGTSVGVPNLPKWLDNLLNFLS